MKYNKNLREEELKNKVSADFFGKFDGTRIVGNIDFCITVPHETSGGCDMESLLWAEAKAASTDILVMLAQLVLTVGKARTFDKHLPPPFLGCFDNEKIAFVPYSEIQDIFYQNDFNWNVAPSNHDTKEFQLIYERIKDTVENETPRETCLFHFEKDEKELRRFIRDNFVVGKSEVSKIKIDKNNFIIIYNKWLEAVKPTVGVDWEIAKRNGIIDGDFYLADLLSQNNRSVRENLFVLLKSNHYEADRHLNAAGLFTSSRVEFTDGRKAYSLFWAKYERPPAEQYWDYIVKRRDLLVPQDIRERKGSFFTPQVWVELSQRYLADVFGEDWQDEYYVWDCAAGTGNLLAGLTDKYKIWASTLDRQDVDVMRDRMKNGANLLEDHVFQFDFLNDDFAKLPEGLRRIINDPKMRKRLIVYINPPYAEGNNEKNKSRKDVHATKIYSKYKKQLDKVGVELFAQFLIRIYFEIPGCKIGQFSKLKLVGGSNSAIFRNHFLAKPEKLFLVPADTFDNVTGQFPIGFFIWNTEQKYKFKKLQADVYNGDGSFSTTKEIYSYEDAKGKINGWLTQNTDKNDKGIGILVADAPDFQNNNYIVIQNNKGKSHKIYFTVTLNNLILSAIYFTVRKVIPATWLNDRDQFLHPNEKWETDVEFQNDCLAYALFNNNISVKEGVNHWIPFAEGEVDARTEFESHFMISFLSGKIVINAYTDLFNQSDADDNPKTNWKKGRKREFSVEAQAVFDAGRKLWKYYHSHENVNVNASLYDIREHFQGRNEKGKMNNKSEDESYNEFIESLRASLRILAKKIEPKVYEYGFLKE